jgi:hypothetical protein
MLLKNTHSNIHGVRCAHRDIEMLVDRERNVCAHTQRKTHSYGERCTCRIICICRGREGDTPEMWVHTGTHSHPDRCTQGERDMHMVRVTQALGDGGGKGGRDICPHTHERERERDMAV